MMKHDRHIVADEDDVVVDGVSGQMLPLCVCACIHARVCLLYV